MKSKLTVLVAISAALTLAGCSQSTQGNSNSQSQSEKSSQVSKSNSEKTGTSESSNSQNSAKLSFTSFLYSNNLRKRMGKITSVR